MTRATARSSASAAGSPSAADRRSRPRAVSDLLPRRPYPGLRPFEKAEWPIFRGRDRLIQDILTILADNHFVSVIGPSGSGKSSLVRAGVLATLERRHSRVGVRWRTGTMRPGASPLWSMADGMLRSLRPDLVTADGELPAAEVARLRVLIDASDDGLARVAQEFGLEEDENFLLLVDQFEEIFRYRSDAEDPERTRLIEVLLAVANSKPSGLYIITTMRSEYLGDCARFKGLAETLNETHYLLPRMTEDELRQAIIEPAELKNGRIEDALIERLLNDIRGQEDQLPILQHTLLWMWIQEEERQEQEHPAGDRAIELGLADYEQLEPGRRRGQAEHVKNALSRHGNRILDGMSPEERRVAEIMFRRMVEVEEHSNRLRRPTQCGTVARLAEIPLEVVQRVVDAFRADDASFIYVNRQRIADDTSIDIMHESLIRQWDTLDQWVRSEKASCEVYQDLCRAAHRMQEGQGALLSGLALSRAQHWLDEQQPTRLWARRYGGDFDAAIRFLADSEEAEEERQRQAKAAEEAARRQEEERRRLQNELEQQALRGRLEEQTKLAQQRRRFTHWATGAALVAGVVAAIAGSGFLYWHHKAVSLANQVADEALVTANAASFWSRLQLFGDPLKPEDVASLWDLAREDERVRVAFVRQLANDRWLLRRFGFNPQPVARAVGLPWPDEAREIAKQSLAHVASNQFDPSTADLFELITYTRALAALQQVLDPALAEAATQKIANAINGLAREEPLTDRQLWALAETVGVFSGRLDPEMIDVARERLHREITTPAPGGASGQSARAISRAIEVMAPELDDSERLQALRDLAPLLGQEIDSWSAKSIPRTVSSLLGMVDPAEAPELLSALPPAIARAAMAKSDRESSYLLPLMQLSETLGTSDDEELVTAFARTLAAQLALPNEPRQRAALARAAVPLLARSGGDAPALVSTVAATTLIPEQAGGGLDTAHRTLLRQAALRALQQALAAPDGKPRESSSQAALELIEVDWKAQSSRDDQMAKAPEENRAAGSLDQDGQAQSLPGATPNPYRRAAQVRLAAMLAPSLPSEVANRASADLRAMVPDTEDYLTRDAIARALTALAPKLSDPERAEALLAAKLALAKTGSREEATVWADAIAALLPADPRAATAEIVGALKYPTATEAPTDVLLAGLAKPWPEEHKTIAGRTLPDLEVVDWLEAHLPDGYGIADPRLLPKGLTFEHADTGPDPG